MAENLVLMFIIREVPGSYLDPETASLTEDFHGIPKLSRQMPR
jgi:hypothetical protein